MIDLDIRDFERGARLVGAYADQVPFALALALNDAVKVAKEELVGKTWPQHMQVRNARFLSAALTTKGSRATKRNLRVELYDKLGRGNLVLHEKGGTRTPRGAAIAVPSAALQGRRSGGGVPKGLRPRSVPNSVKKVGKYGTEVIFQQTGSYKKATASAHKRAAKAGEKRPKGTDGRHLKLMYSLRPSVPVRAEVPFHADFARVMRREVHHAFGPRLKAAMASRRK